MPKKKVDTSGLRSGPRCSGCKKPIEQNHKITKNPRNSNDHRHPRCAPRTWAT